jgi:hypothetical protein
MNKTFCDKCGKEKTNKQDVQLYQIVCKVEAIYDDEDIAQDYAIESQQIDLCQPCVKNIVPNCKDFLLKNGVKDG